MAGIVSEPCNIRLIRIIFPTAQSPLIAETIHTNFNYSYPLRKIIKKAPRNPRRLTTSEK